MKELISDSQVFWAALAVSVVGGTGFVLWLRRRGSAAWGAGWFMIALTWPLWMLFELLDRWLDAVTVRGFLAPYAVFIVIGLAVGVLFRRGVFSTAETRRRRDNAEERTEPEG